MFESTSLFLGGCGFESTSLFWRDEGLSLQLCFLGGVGFDSFFGGGIFLNFVWFGW